MLDSYPEIPYRGCAADEDYEWDDTKAAGNLAKHGVGFGFAVRVFDDPAVLLVDATNPADGEVRIKAIGSIDGRLFVAVFTDRPRIRRLISARRANAKETRCYVGSL